jgi:pantoate--beta-alanine ligase
LALAARLKAMVAARQGVRLDYLELRHPDTLEEVESLSGPTLLALAAWVGKTRLIDNALLLEAGEA